MATSSHRLARPVIVCFTAANAALAAEASHVPAGTPVILDIDSISRATAWAASCKGASSRAPRSRAQPASASSSPAAPPRNAGTRRAPIPPWGMSYDFGTLSAAPMVGILINQGDLREARIRLTLVAGLGASRTTITHVD